MSVMVAFDAIHDHVDAIPPRPFAVGGYINGAITKYIWSAADWAKFPDAYHIRINVTGDPDRGNALDVENGDATPADVTPWINSRGASSAGPLLVYCNRSNLTACMAARKAAKYPAWLWLATLDGTLAYDRAMTQIGQIREPIHGGAVADYSFILNQTLVGQMQAKAGKQ